MIYPVDSAIQHLNNRGQMTLQNNHQPFPHTLHTENMVQVHSNKTKQPFLLKGLSLEDNAVLGQFCAEVILLSAFAHIQNAPEVL